MHDLKNKFTIVVIGRSGCGKGTQAEILLRKFEHLGVEHLETGRALRELLKKDNPSTAIAREVMKAGRLFPWWYPVFTWLKALLEDGAVANHIVFDGAPRRMKEAELIDEVISWHGRPLPVGLYIDVGEEESKKRLLLRGRADDQPEAIKNRLAFFEPDVVPIIKHYEGQERLVTVNGEQTVEKVAEEVEKKLKEKLGDLWPIS